MPDELSLIAARIEAAEKERAALAGRLRFNSGKMKFSETIEESLYCPVEKVAVNGKVSAVDSGIIGEELHGFNFLLSRTVGVVFDYKASRPSSHLYFPSAIPPLAYDVRAGLDSHDVIWHKSLFRLKVELTCAAQIIGRENPAYMLLDGSIAPLLSDKPPEDSEMHPLYQEVVGAYRSLYEKAWGSGCTLAGVIKDSRSKRFIEIVGRHAQNEPGLLHTTDSNFLHFLLSAGERTCAFAYSSAPSKHQILKDLGGWSEKILSFYLKPVKDDRPLRVEFLSGQKPFGEIASFIHSLSCQHKSYAYPAVLIEADMRAALSTDDFEYAYGSLWSKIGGKSSLMRLRRNSRPFR